MKIVFIYPDLASDNPNYTGYFYHGIACLSAVLKKAGHQTALIQFTKEISSQDFQKRIKILQPDLIGFSSTTHVFPFVQKYARAAKEIIKAPIICGGVHASLSPQEVLEDKNIDMVCVGEGERVILELCRQLEQGKPLNSIEKIWFRPLIPNLDDLPFPDREIYDYPGLNLEKQGIGAFMFSRGCPYQCSFCCESSLRKLYPNSQKYFRFRSPGSAIAELKKVIADYPFIKFVRFDDDLLFARKNWVKEFVELYQQEIALPFSADMRINLVDEELLALLKQGGVHLLRFGVESGNDFILKQVLNKNITVEQIKNVFALCRQKGIKAQAYNMIGLPYEGPKEILRTIKLNAQIKPDISVVSIFYPYHGTELYNVCLEKGFLKKEQERPAPKNYYTRSVLSLPSIRKAQISFFFQYFHILKFLYTLPFLRPLNFFFDKIFSFRYMPEIAKFTLTPLRKAIKCLRRKIKHPKTFNTEARA